MTKASEGFGLLDLADSEAIESLSLSRPRARFFVNPEGPSDPSEQQYMKIVEASGSLSFWEDDAEDIYTDDDGQDV